MKDNFHLSLWGKKVQLVPYRKKFVPRYHEWMQDDYILHMTASEPLTIEEEYEMQQSWRDDKKKCTFIVLQSPSSESNEEKPDLDRMAGDVNLFLSRSHEDESLVSEIDIMIAEPSLRRSGLGREAVQMMMWYGTVHLQIHRFFAKINKDNVSSIKLFESLGYELKNYAEAFQEYEYVYEVTNNEDHQAVIKSFGEHIRMNEYNEDDL